MRPSVRGQGAFGLSSEWESPEREVIKCKELESSSKRYHSQGESAPEQVVFSAYTSGVSAPDQLDLKLRGRSRGWGYTHGVSAPD